VVRTAGMSELKPGERVSLKIDPARMYLFDR
jgi:cold shock CspA family protein